jgi:predicted phosphodiesterase
MRNLLRAILYKPVLWAAGKFSSKPHKTRIFEALSALLSDIKSHPGKKGIVIPFDIRSGRFIIFSDQHKGGRNGADDFMMAESNYLAALAFYNEKNFTFINLGDSEELWENTIWKVKKKNIATFEAEKNFLKKEKYIKVYGNHDLYWDMSPFAPIDLKNMYGEEVKIYEGVVLETEIKNSTSGKPTTPLIIFLTHGHQGDAQSDGNWFSKTFVSLVWAPMQSLLRINPNTPAYNAEKKTLHNSIMYDWSATHSNLLLVTGHTHQPVFKSLTLLEKLYKDYQYASTGKNEEQLTVIAEKIRKVEKEFTAVSVDYMNMKPSYFNTGCCCFSDGDITGIEIEDGMIRLIKWKKIENNSTREILEEVSLEAVGKQL